MMYKDFNRNTIHVNRSQSNSWSIGIDFYCIYEQPVNTLQAKVLLIGLGFFNITFTRWYAWR